MEKIPVYEGSEPYIFISYAHRDSGVVLPVISELYGGKYRVWYDEGIAPGSEWPHYIAVHLENADAVIAFISDASTASVNCENEIVRAKELGKTIIAYSIDGCMHGELKDCAAVDQPGSLKELLDDRLLGDGISGYEQSLGKGDSYKAWVSFVGGVVASVLLAALLLGLILIQNDSIGDFLQGGRTAEAEEEQQGSVDEIDNDLLNEAILLNSAKDELVQEPEFSSEEIRESFEEAIGWDKDRNIIYYDLINDKREEITIETADDEVLALLRYFPALKKATIKSGDISSTEAAGDCLNLRTLELGYDIFPVDIPENKTFKVKVLK